MSVDGTSIAVNIGSQYLIECSTTTLVMPEKIELHTSVYSETVVEEFEFPEVNDTVSVDILGDPTGLIGCGSRTYTLQSNPNLLVPDPSSPRSLELFTDDEDQIAKHIYSMTVTLDDHPDVAPLVVNIEVLITLTNDHCKNYGFNLTAWQGPANKEIIIGQYNFYIFEDAFTEWEIESAIESGLGVDNVKNLCGQREYIIE